MEWIYENWLLLVLAGGMIGMHLFGHGHGRHRNKDNPAPRENTPESDPTVVPLERAAPQENPDEKR